MPISRIEKSVVRIANDSVYGTGVDGDVTVSFTARVDDWVVRKTFVLHDAQYTIDLILEFKNICLSY
jgi:hypothetical protein